MQLAVSTCGVLYWREGQLVWDDYLGQRQHALTAMAEPVVRWFASWKELDSVRELAAGQDDDVPYTIALQLHEAEILVAQNSARHLREQDVLRTWGAWGTLPRAFHFATRLRADQQFVGHAEDRRRLLEKSTSTPPPPAFTELPDAETVSLSAASPRWDEPDLVGVLTRRRSVRRYGTQPVPLDKLAAVLRLAAGPVGDTNPTELGTVFKTSPSGGGRHPTELYLAARDVDGIDPGVYHYNGARHRLERVAAMPSRAEVTAICGDQEWVGEAQAVLFYTSVVARHQWKYDTPRAYRVLLLDVGHLNQTVALLATALGLRTTFTAALRDELVEELLSCDPASEFVVGCATLGTPAEE